MRSFHFSLALAAAVASLFLTTIPTTAATFTESEDATNNTFGTAESLNSTDTTLTVNGFRTDSNSADYYAFNLNAGDRVTMAITGVTALFANDPFLAFYLPNGDLLAADDDSYGDLLPQISDFLVLTSGTFRIAVGDFGDANRDAIINSFANLPVAGGGASDYDYTLQINITPVPEPSAFAGILLFGFGTVAARRARSRRARI
ncbi:MAG: pre-peptidase C-terminal domain-containing protein [Anaerolineae bacterium]|nr:pre-peptidase C-terminal domain-containing protein [Gloeobacterales cyanobacterium ES-bin-313]